MKIKSIKSLSLFLLLFAITTSCKKQLENDPTIPVVEKTANSSRLNFSSQDNFEQLANELVGKDKSEILNKISSITKGSEFISLQSVMNAKMNQKSGIFTSDEESTDTLDLVQDEFFASVLNENMEIKVDSVIYKVTPFGTFIIDSEKYGRTIELLEANHFDEKEDFSAHKFFSHLLHDDFYKVEDGIILLDTYKRISGGLDEDATISQPVALSNKKASTVSAEGDDYIYNNIPTISFGAKTIAGKLFEKLRGREEVYTDEFENKRRIRVNFYNASWGIYSSIGASVKMQKKNWIGWSGTDAPELRLGWDGLEYYCGTVPSIPTPTQPGGPQRFNPLDLPYVSKRYVEVDLLGYPFTYDINKGIQQGVKKAYDFAKSNIQGLFPQPPNVNYAYKAWNDFTKKSISIIGGQDEVKGYNRESLSKVFDWAVGITVKSNFENINFNAQKNIMNPALKFELRKASVYGLVKYGNIWKGARIVAQ